MIIHETQVETSFSQPCKLHRLMHVFAPFLQTASPILILKLASKGLSKPMRAPLATRSRALAQLWIRFSKSMCLYIHILINKHLQKGRYTFSTHLSCPSLLEGKAPLDDVHMKRMKSLRARTRCLQDHPLFLSR